MGSIVVSGPDVVEKLELPLGLFVESRDVIRRLKGFAEEFEGQKVADEVCTDVERIAAAREAMARCIGEMCWMVEMMCRCGEFRITFDDCKAAGLDGSHRSVSVQMQA